MAPSARGVVAQQSSPASTGEAGTGGGRYPVAVKTRDIRDLVWFADDEARHETLFETEQLWTQVVCLQEAQGIGPMRDDASDAVLTVLAGEVATQAGKGRARMRQWEAVLIEAGTELTIRNASDEPSVVLLTLAPPPDSGSSD
jgi:quercetin dioxygenase-like cupin family protein